MSEAVQELRRIAMVRCHRAGAPGVDPVRPAVVAVLVPLSLLTQLLAGLLAFAAPYPLSWGKSPLTALLVAFVGFVPLLASFATASASAAVALWQRPRLPVLWVIAGCVPWAVFATWAAALGIAWLR
jgi:hypothetical protein